MPPHLSNEATADKSTAIPLPIVAKLAGRKTEWLSILMGTLMAFISSVHFSLYFTSLWPFLKTLDPSLNEAFFGLVVAAYSLAQIIASPLFGIWANRCGILRPSLLLCNGIMFVGNWLYFLVEIFPGGARKWTIILARFITGAGSSQISLLRAHASAASTFEDRSRATALVTGGVAIGLSLGPAFQIFFSWLDYPGITLISDHLHLSMFNFPALFCSFLNVINVLFLVFFFREGSAGILERKPRHKKIKQNDDKKKSPSDDCANANGDGAIPSVKLPPPDSVAILLCYLIRFTQQFIITNLETIGSSFAMLMFLWTPKQVVVYEAMAHSARGLVALGVYVVYIAFDLGKILNDRLVCLLSLVGLLLFHLATFSWPFLPNAIPIASSTNASSSPPSNSGVGCSPQLNDWCFGLRQVDPIVYYVMMITMIGLAFPLINVSMQTLFSRIIGPRLQAKQQGMLQMCGGMGRMLGPLLIGFLYSLYGPRVVWLIECVVILATGLLWLHFYRRLVPLKMPSDEEQNISSSQISTISTGSTVK